MVALKIIDQSYLFELFLKIIFTTYKEKIEKGEVFVLLTNTCWKVKQQNNWQFVVHNVALKAN